MFVLWFWYVSDMICCYDLFMAWFCCYDFDMVSVMILIWFQLCFLLWVKLVIWSQPIGTISKKYSKIVSKPYQYRIKIKSKPRKPAKNRPKTCPWAVSVLFFEANSLEPYQNRIKIISKSYQNRNKTHIEIIIPNSKHIKFISSTRIQNHIEIVKKEPEFSILEVFRAYNPRQSRIQHLLDECCLADFKARGDSGWGSHPKQLGWNKT